MGLTSKPKRAEDIFCLQVQEVSTEVWGRSVNLGHEIFLTSGPYQPWVYYDLENFRTSLASHSNEFERMEADDVYIDEAQLQVKCHTCAMIPEEHQEIMIKRKWAQQETINMRFKQWLILKQISAMISGCTGMSLLQFTSSHSLPSKWWNVV